MVSPDGLKWTRCPKPICDVFADSQDSGFWDSSTGKYVLYGRVAGNIGRAESASFTLFDPLRLVLQTDERDPPNSNLYNPAAMKYPGAANLYLMFPSLHRHEPDTLDIRLAVSRDGVRWTWPEQNAAFIPLGETGAFDSKTLYMGQGLIEVGEEMWLYYSGEPRRHNEGTLETLVHSNQPRAYRRAVVRRDRFISVDAGREGGSFVTPPLRFTGNTLTLNVEVRPGGKVRVGLLNEKGEAAPGRAVEDCQAVTDDRLDAVVKWKNGTDVSDRVGRPTRMRVELTDASLYGFQFTTPGL
jgi:hypothetical protein